MKSLLLLLTIIGISCSSNVHVENKFNGEYQNIPLGPGISKTDGNHVVEAIRNITDEELYIYSIYRYKDYIDVLTLPFRPGKNSVGLSGDSFRFEYNQNEIVFKEKRAWIQ